MNSTFVLLEDAILLTSPRSIAENNNIGMHNDNTTDSDNIAMIAIPVCGIIFICVVLFGCYWRPHENVDKGVIKYHQHIKKTANLRLSQSLLSTNNHLHSGPYEISYDDSSDSVETLGGKVSITRAVDDDDENEMDHCMNVCIDAELESEDSDELLSYSQSNDII